MEAGNARRGNRWLEMIHTREVALLARRYGISLDEKLVQFLEEYSEIVLHVTNKQKERKTNQAQLLQELENVNKVVQEEVSTIRTTLFQKNEEADRYFFTEQHQETYLPIVHLAIKGLPELLVHVTRSYATRKKGISFGLLAKNNGGVLSGATARAANYLRRRCRDMHWELSVSEIVNLWYQQVLDIPPEDRMRPERNPPSAPKRRRLFRKRARSNNVVQVSAADITQEEKAQKAKRVLSEGGSEENSNRSPISSQKRRRTDALGTAEIQVVPETALSVGGEEKDPVNVGGKEKALKPGVASDTEAEAKVGKNPLHIEPTSNSVEENVIEKRGKTGEITDSSPFEILIARKEASRNLELEPGPRTTRYGSVLVQKADNEDQELGHETDKLKASAFLTPSSLQRLSSLNGDYKQVDIDEGFDTIGGLADYDSDDSDNGGGDVNREQTQPRQQICFEQASMSHEDRTSDSEKGEVAEGAMAVKTNDLQSVANEKQFVSFRFADALSAVNLAGNDEVAPYVKREHEEQGA